MLKYEQNLSYVLIIYIFDKTQITAYFYYKKIYSIVTKLTSKLESLNTKWPFGWVLASLTALYDDGLLDVESNSSATQG